MAEAVVTFFLEKLSTLITEEANLLLGVDEQVRLLQNDLEWMRLLIKNQDAERRADPEVKLLVRQIRDITFKAEDVIDDFILKIHQRGQQRIDLDRFTRSITSCIRCTRQLPILHELGNEIKAINLMSKNVSENKSRYCIKGESSNSSNGISSLPKVKRAPIAGEWDVVGIEDSMKQVKSLLVGSGGDDDRRRRIVVSITGMGGLGKTTLAKKVYNSIDVRRHFDCFAWVSVSREYRLTELLQGIIKCVTTQYSRDDLEKLDEEELRKMLHEYLQGEKKYLIVLDDIWDTQAWDGLSTAFPDEKNGSRILLTTRNTNVAAFADSSSNNIHELRFLDLTESWELFMKKIFPLGGGRGNSTTQESRCPPDLKDLGKEMVDKCRGLPLAIVVLGGLLLSKDRTHIAWSKVNASVSWQLTDHGASSHYSCSEILALSYYDLPYYLKPCFMYMGLFPEDHEIPAFKLFQYWIAEGFVRRRGEETMEDVAEDYLEELIHRSMIQVGSWRFDGRVKTCRIHDLLRDISIKESKEDQFFQVYGIIDDDFSNSSNNVRRLTIHGDRDGSNKGEQYFSQFRYTRNIRSLMCFGVSVEGKQFWTSLCGGFKLLRVLELEIRSSSTTLTLPQEIGDLVHLKYFGLSNYDEKTIPNSISKLVNLQTLNLTRGFMIEYISNQIWSLCQLRHLYVSHIASMSSKWDRRWNIRSSACHLGIDNLTNLQTLSISSGDWINDGRLGKLSMLKKLVIQGDTFSHKNEFFDSIAKLSGLRKLDISTNEKFPSSFQVSRNSFLTKLRLSGGLSSDFLFPQNLIKLTLSRSCMETELMVQVLEKLPHLKILVLDCNACIGEKMLLLQGQFLRLQVLQLAALDALQELIVEEGALISLTRLVIDECEEMEMLPDGLRLLTTLQILEVNNMPEEFNARLAENVGEDWNKIKHIPSVIMDLYLSN
ncbi:Disease resistance protein [Macleaya cordata]|uniref:Disease resistance protein n=1 Tax=Macleaya cordata TaxID=56857 RepID=A0A200PQE3_MACCD|nr:Disease resistance protein [Macleaya cordata]